MSRGKRTDGKRPLRGAAKHGAALGAVRRPKAMELRLQGKTYAEIGEALGISEKNAWRHVQKAMQSCDAEAAAGVETLRKLGARRLDALLVKLWPAVEDGDPKAITAAVQIEKRRAELLGLDMPKKHALTDEEGKSVLPFSVVRAILGATEPA